LARDIRTRVEDKSLKETESKLEKLQENLSKREYDKLKAEVAVNPNKIVREILEKYLFSWDEIPGNDNGKLIEFLKQKFGIDWVKTAEIEKIDNGNTIKVSNEINNLSLNLNQEKTEVIFKIDDVRTDKFIAEMENSKLIIYLEKTI